MSTKTYVIGHYAAPNDTNGNPRRVFVLYRVDKGYLSHVAARDEGYEGDGVETVLGKFKAFPGAESAAFLPRVNVTPKEYRRLLNNRTLQAVKS